MSDPSPKPPTVVGPGEVADRQREAVHYRVARVMQDGTQEDLPDWFLDPPEIGGLAQRVVRVTRAIAGKK